MTRPRSQLIALDSTPFYHCVARCVRRAFLCGTDSYSGKCFDHRKPWVIARLKHLEQAFAIDIAGYAIMSNHYHLILHADKARTLRWSREEIIRRWLLLYKGPAVIHRFQEGLPMSSSEMLLVDKLVSVWRARLCNISWFMACLNEYIARRANREDDCTGRFWEGRFKSQALLDETALISCMAYVDLNPIRAGLAKSPASSNFTSLQQRIFEARQSQQLNKKPKLMAFRDAVDEQSNSTSIPFNLEDYQQLVEWTADAIRQSGEAGPSVTPSMLPKLGLTALQWQVLALEVQKQSILMLHGLERIARMEQRQHRHRAA